MIWRTGKVCGQTHSWRAAKGEWAETGEYIYDFANKGYVRTETGEYMTWRTEEVGWMKQDNL